MQVRRSLSVVLIDEDGATRPVPRLSGNTKSLLMMFVLFTLITAAQWVGGVMAHSLALQADCASMGVDALSYVGNMLAECQTDRRPSTWTTMPSAWHARPAPPSGSQGRGGSFGSAAAAARTRAAASRVLTVASSLGLASG